MDKKFLVFPILLILLPLATIPYSYASVESEAQEDIQAGCRDAQTLVYRFAYKDFVCVEPSTAVRWVNLGMAEIIQENSQDSTDEVQSVEPTEFPGSPPPPPQRSPSDVTADCRPGFTLVHRITYDDLYCINSITAITWERLGLSEIVDAGQSEEATVEQSEEATVGADGLISKDLKVIEESILDEEQEFPFESEQKVNGDTSSSDLIDYSDFPKIHSIGNQIWAIVDYDKSSSVLIEGDSGIIMIDSLNSYESMKKAMDNFKTITDKDIKTIVFTTVSPESVFASSVVTTGRNADVTIVLSDEVLYLYNSDYGLNIQNAVTFGFQFSIDVGGVNLDLITANGFDNSEQTYILLPDYDRLLVGDDKHGIFPVLLDMEYLQIFNDQKSNKPNNAD